MAEDGGSERESDPFRSAQDIAEDPLTSCFDVLLGHEVLVRSH